MVLELFAVIYWLSLATWFGAVLFLVIAPSVILRVVRENNPILPHVLSVNLEGQHGTLLAGTIVAALCKYIVPLELTCFLLLGISLAAQWVTGGAFVGTWSVAGDRAIVLPLVFRTMLFVMAGGFFLYDWRFVFPRLMKFRQEYLDHADNPEVANPALDQFDRYSNENQSMLRNTLIALLGLLVFSATTMIKPVAAPAASPAATAAPAEVAR